MLRRFAIFPALLLLIPGCSSFNRHMMTPAYHPQNVFVWGSGLPAGVRRVAVLPLICEPENADLIDGCEALEPIILQELAKTHRFEVTRINQYDLCSRTGKSLWTCDETLPQGLFSWLADSQGCDAVLFCRLTVYRGYPPLAVGYRMRLVE